MGQGAVIGRYNRWLQSGLEKSESGRPVNDGGARVCPACDVRRPRTDLAGSPFCRVIAGFKRLLMSRPQDRTGVESGGRGNTVMTLSRALPLALALAVMPLGPAAAGPRQAGPTLSDALGATPLVPNASATKKGSSTFDTLTGSPLSPQ